MQSIHDSLTIDLFRIREHLMAYFRPILHKYEISEQQWRVIHYLHECNETTSERMKYGVCLSSPSLTGMLSRMVDKGLLHRRPDPHDKRCFCISLTQKGKDIYAKVAPEASEAYKQIEQDFGIAELQILRSVLEILETKMQKIHPHQ